jgi:hypothetical protein
MQKQFYSVLMISRSKRERGDLRKIKEKKRGNPQ